RVEISRGRGPTSYTEHLERLIQGLASESPHKLVEFIRRQINIDRNPAQFETCWIDGVKLTSQCRKILVQLMLTCELETSLERCQADDALLFVCFLHKASQLRLPDSLPLVRRREAHSQL